jgi:hypothetical protein
MKTLDYTIVDIEFPKTNSMNAVAKIEVGETHFELEIFPNRETQIETPSEIKLFESLLGKFDPTRILNHYNRLAEKIEEIRENEAREEARETYRTHWSHAAIASLKETEVTARPKLNEEKYVQDRPYDMGVELEYKNNRITVEYKDVSPYYSYSGKNMKYSICGDITDYKTRNYAKFETAVKKFKTLVDEKTAQELRKKELKNTELQRQIQQLKKIEKLFGGSTIEEKYHRGWGRNTRGYTTHEYHVVREEKSYKISENFDGTWNLMGFKNLTTEKVNAILDLVHN